MPESLGPSEYPLSENVILNCLYNTIIKKGDIPAVLQDTVGNGKINDCPLKDGDIMVQKKEKGYEQEFQ